MICRKKQTQLKNPVAKHVTSYCELFLMMGVEGGSCFKWFLSLREHRVVTPLSRDHRDGINTTKLQEHLILEKILYHFSSF
jgi:hypothetical protein